MIRCTPIGAVGAEVDGIDLNMISDDDLENLKALFAEKGLLFFRDQELSPDAHLDFAKKWGQLMSIDSSHPLKAIRVSPKSGKNLSKNTI